MTKVLHLGKFYPPSVGGIEVFLGDLLPALQQEEVEARALVHSDPALSLEAESEMRKITVYRSKCYGQLLYTPIAPGYPFLFHRILHEFRPDILHIHLPNFSPFWALFLPAALRIPWVIHWHSDIVISTIDKRLGPAYRIYRIFEQRLLKRAAMILTTSEKYLNSSKPLASWKTKCRAVPLGLDSKRFSLSNYAIVNTDTFWGESSSRFRILSIGRLTYYKGYEILIRAASLLENIQICIVGDGDQKDALKQLIKQEAVSDKVKLCGGLSKDKVHGLLSSCHCLCLPSLERTEAFGLVLLEAMFFSKPVIASNIPGSGVGWVVKDGETGTLVPPGDPVLLAEAIASLAYNPDTQKRYGLNGRTRLEDFFHIETVATQIREIYKQVMNNV